MGDPPKVDSLEWKIPSRNGWFGNKPLKHVNYPSKKNGIIMYYPILHSDSKMIVENPIKMDI